MFYNLLNPTSSPSHHLNLNTKPLLLSASPSLKLSRLRHFKFLNSTHPSLLPSNPSPSKTPINHYSLSESFQFLKPFILSEKKTILSGWFCSFVSVYSLSKIVPKVGKFSSMINKVDAFKLRDEGLLLGVFVLARLVANCGQQMLLWDAALNAVYKLRVHVFNSVLERELGFFEGKGGVPAGDIAHRITAEASDVADTIYAILNTIVPSTLQLWTMVTQMLVVSPALSLISAMLIPCMALVIVFLGGKLCKISTKAHLSFAALSAYLNEVLPAILFVKANNCELCENARFQGLAHSDFLECSRKKKMKALIPHITLAVYFGALLVLCIGSLVLLSGAFDGCSIVSFVTSLILLVEPIQDVGKAFNELRQGEPAVERLYDLTRFKHKVVEKPDAVDLDYLNLHVKPGETVALVGPSGGGKTTLVKLLLRLCDPLSGSILIDNHDIQSIQLESLRRHVGLVSQDITLFSGTVAENIGYRDLMTKIDMERVEHAARTANADEFIRELSEGYLTNIGPRGSILSGGQKQRLAIARALYQNSSILILDEATSALDSRSELLVRQAVECLMKNHTVLVIAHRLETALMAKRVFLLDNGKLEELTPSTLLGTRHDSLLSAGLVI
ncbi:ABC transporter family protein [Quillaja saponaria]|uniref:ABC transporter family protein n=1 Tax=Quillaja saponaria TaxID=32244 RepID=A0AAD7Q781_QUISA|nr:ABC transporter family protein [Quillaja saponaria]